MNKRRKKFWIILIAGLVLLFVGYQVLRELYVEDNRRFRISIRETIKEKYPEKAEEMRARYGIKPANGSGYEPTQDPGISDVILVHGMDDPGKVWLNLSPMLLDRGFRVWFLFYPDDQPIAESARLFYEEMILFRKNGHERVSVVAFSMGGLVSRELLTCPELNYSRGIVDKKVPEVSQLILVATPNQGSDLARFRIFAELREQTFNLFNSEYVWLQSILDGAGEAGLDLTPGSPFLEALNSRPHPEDVPMVVIAGMMGKSESGDIETFIDGLKRKLPDSTHDLITQMGSLLNSMTEGVGDGLVPVDSAKLEGIPLHVVPGTHLSIIRNVRENSRRTPPAIPIILEYLNEP